MVSLVKPLNATRKTDPTDFSRLYSKLMNNKSSLYFTSGEIQPMQKVTVPVKHPGWKAVQGLKQLKTVQALSLKSDSTPIKPLDFFISTVRRIWP